MAFPVFRIFLNGGKPKSSAEIDDQPLHSWFRPPPVSRGVFNPPKTPELNFGLLSSKFAGEARYCYCCKE